ncbi:MAG: type VI secretion system ATPase TssH, partial [Oscillospiraceae bacterium]|nr:type VI secretion system ATPase TssH [Oscillospiraceae bacterium]
SEIGQIAELQLRNLRKNLDGKQLKLEITDAAKEMIVREGYDPVYGARPLKRFIQSRVETAIAKCILRDDPAPGDTVTVDVTDGEITARV